MIRKIPYSDIDFEKYDSCIENSVQKNFYAKKEILDFLCDAWEILVYEDYVALMPVPTKKIAGFQYIIAPIFSQQLGVFSKVDNPELNEKFRIYLQNKYQVIYYPFNDQNNFTSTITTRKNYELPHGDYSLLKKNFSKGRKAILAKNNEQNFINKLPFEDYLEPWIKEHFKGLNKTSDIENFIKFTRFLEQKNQLNIYSCNSDQKISSLAIVAKDKKKLILLALINDKSTLKNNGATYLVDHILQENIAEKDFDFMGGNLRGIEIFFKSFGAQLKEYPIIENSKKTILKKLLKL